MLRGVLAAALAGKTVLVTMLDSFAVRDGKDILARIAARRSGSPAALAKVSDTKEAIDRVTFVAVDEEQDRTRGRRFDVRVADHSVLAERLKSVAGADWLR